MAAHSENMVTSHQSSMMPSIWVWYQDKWMKAGLSNLLLLGYGGIEVYIGYLDQNGSYIDGRWS